MRRLSIYVVLIAVLDLLLVVEVGAQRGMRWRGSGGWGPEGQYGRMYDPKTVEVVNGEVVSVEKLAPKKGMAYGVHLTLKTEKEAIPIHLGPGWYIENQEVRIAPGDKIEVKGSRITYAGKPAIVAAEVRRSDGILRLRDENGFPVWAGWRRRPAN